MPQGCTYRNKVVVWRILLALLLHNDGGVIVGDAEDQIGVQMLVVQVVVGLLATGVNFHSGGLKFLKFFV
jgi:hypothetical protein